MRQVDVWLSLEFTYHNLIVDEPRIFGFKIFSKTLLPFAFFAIFFDIVVPHGYMAQLAC